MIRLARAFALPRAARIEIYHTVAGLLEAGRELEGALETASRAARDQGQPLRARALERWRQALGNGRFAETVPRWLPASEAMLFHGYGRVDATALFAAAARVAELRERQTAAVARALAMPCLLGAGVVVLLWAAGGHFVPVMETIAPPDLWPAHAQAFRAVSLWLHGNPATFLAALLLLGGLLASATLAWTGPGRTALDRLPPFNLYRMLAGSAFLFAVLEFLRAGVDVNDRAFEALRRSAAPYARHRIGAIQRGMRAGKGLGQAMVDAGHRFPDPALVHVVAALDGQPGWPAKLSGFVDRWTARSERTMRARAAGLNAAMTTAAALVTGVAMDSMFRVLDAAGSALG